jgi:class 3 adenylate cyclase/tetratricopeptide (TPR) repeat protein
VSTTCPTCGHENHDGRKFCTQCGERLAGACPACGAVGQPGERFCGDCGASLAAAPISATSSPAAVPSAGEKKQITVLFADVAGSMDLQEQMDAEVWAQVMGRFVSILAEGVRRFGGTVDNFTGDGIMALFGAPVALEDHARRACHAAWHLTKAIGEYSGELRRVRGVELHVRLGLNSGEVVVDRVGDDVTLDPTALGHTVGLAQRMEAMAEPGKAYLTEHTAHLVNGWFPLEELGARSVKGASAPLRIFVLGGPVSSPVGRTVGAAPLVGRDRELALLEDALGMATEGHAQVVGVVGEAGVGKSRLCDEFARSAASRGVTVRRTAGVSHGKDVPFLPVLSLLRQYFGVNETDPATQARARIASRLLALDPALDENLPLIFDFLEVADPERPAPQLAPDIRMDRLLSTFRRITTRRSEREVLVLVAEDLHWFDPQSEAFLERLIESFPGSRTLVVTNFRPEFSARWNRHSYYRQVPLAPLIDTAVSELLDGLLGGHPSVPPLVGLVQERTGGNPFFIEEVVRALVEDGTLAGEPGHYRLVRPVEDIGVPPTVQATLGARIDRLGPIDKRLLQTASVIGRNFPTPVLVMASGVPEHDVAATLGRLCAAEFLQEVSSDPAEEHRFWHPLTREVAYRSLLRDRRVALHEAVARAIVTISVNRLDERAALIAFHFEQAENHLEAARWNDRAAGFAQRGDVIDAMRRWRITLSYLASTVDTDEALAIGIRARNRLIRYGARTGMELDEAAQLYAEAKNLADRLQDATQLASVTFAYGSTLFFRGAVGEARDRYLEAAELADESGDAETQAGYSVLRLVPDAWTGPVPEGLAASERVSALCRGNPDIGASVLGFSPLSLLGVMRAELLFLAGRADEAHPALEESLAIARQRGEAEWIAWGLSWFARLARTPDEFARGLGHAHEALRTAEDSGNRSNRVLAMEAVGSAEAGLRRFDEAADMLAKALAFARERKVALFEEAKLLVHLAVAHLEMGNRQEARQAANEGVDVARRQGAHLVECLALTNRARVWRATHGADDHALADLNAALELVKQTGALAYEPLIREHLGRLRNSEEDLREALRLYRQLGATADAWRLQAELAAGRAR